MFSTVPVRLVGVHLHVIKKKKTQQIMCMVRNDETLGQYSHPCDCIISHISLIISYFNVAFEGQQPLRTVLMKI